MTRADDAHAWGDERLSDRSKDGDADGTPERASKRDSGSTGGSARKKGAGSDIGRALRSVYDDTLRETVPDDFSDLLGKLI